MVVLSFGHPLVAPSPSTLSGRGTLVASGYQAWGHSGWHQASGWHCEGCGSPRRMSPVVGIIGHSPACAQPGVLPAGSAVIGGPGSVPIPPPSLLHFRPFPARRCSGPGGHGEAGSGCRAGGCAPPRGVLCPEPAWAGAGRHVPSSAGGTNAALHPLVVGTYRWEAWKPTTHGCPGKVGGLRAPPQGLGRALAPGSPRPCLGSSWPASPGRML